MDLADFVENAAIGLHSLDERGIILWANRAELEMLGYPAEEYVGRPIADFHVDRPAIEAALARLARGETLHNYEARLRARDGSVKHVLISANVLWREGRFVHTRCFTCEVTDWRQARERERQARRRLTDVIDALPGLVAAVDREGRYELVNRAFERWFGLARDDVVGKPVGEVLGAAAYEVVRPAFDRALAGDPVSAEVELPVELGRRIVQVHAIPQLGDDGGAEGYVSLILDVSRERRFEQAQVFLAEVSKILASSLDYEANLAAVTRAAVPSMGDWSVLYVPDGDLLRAAEIAHDGSYPAELVRRTAEFPIDWRWPDNPLARAFRTGEAILISHMDDPNRARATTGERYREILDAIGVRSAIIAPLVGHGRKIGVLGIASRQPNRFSEVDLLLAREVAARAAVALDNARLYREAEQANRAKDEFLAMLGHELRNPLAPILTATHLMGLRAGDVCLKERTVIERQVQHLVRLVDDLLDVSRLERGKIELRRRRVEIAEVVAKALEIASPLLEQRAHRLHVAVPQSGLAVDADEARLAQVIANLLNNAAKYTERNGRIEVSAAGEGAEVVLRVKDDGAGIAPELIPRIFDHFIQGRQTLSRSEGGLGLGLAIVKILVDLHQGTVSAVSGGPGHGSEFVVRLPLVEAQVGAAPATPSPQAVPAAIPATRSGGLRVLVVDDNRDAADMLAQVLASLGHDTRCAYDALHALELACAFNPSHALVDLGLPVLDGYELARRLREHDPAIVVIAVTGYGQESDRRRARESGFVAHLVKPVDLEVLARLLTRPVPVRTAIH